ncbi:hypothetical protein V6N12_046720 [Hibiscus sabdariffa]|uniref:Uncharacterized protein n=1 Tax=Hibiscus sabdariffa TaxID=183260 RepID=A0ABR2ASR7_9ROSI
MLSTVKHVGRGDDVRQPNILEFRPLPRQSFKLLSTTNDGEPGQVGNTVTEFFLERNNKSFDVDDGVHGGTMEQIDSEQ